MDDFHSTAMIVPHAHPDLPIIDESGAVSGLYAFLLRLEAEASARAAQQRRREAVRRDVANVISPPPCIYASSNTTTRRSRRTADAVAFEEALVWLQRSSTGVVCASKITMPSFIELFRQDYDALIALYGKFAPGDVGIPTFEKAWTYLPTIIEAIDLATLLTPPFDDRTADRVLEHLRTHVLAKPYYDRYVVLFAAHARDVIPRIARMYYLARKGQAP